MIASLISSHHQKFTWYNAKDLSTPLTNPSADMPIHINAYRVRPIHNMCTCKASRPSPPHPPQLPLVRLGLISTNCSSSLPLLSLPFPANPASSSTSSPSSNGLLSFASVVLGLRANLGSSLATPPPNSSSSSEESSSLPKNPPERPTPLSTRRPASRSSCSLAGASDSSSLGSSGRFCAVSTADRSAASGSVDSAASAACLRCARRTASWRRAREGGMLRGGGMPGLEASGVSVVEDGSVGSCERWC